MNSTKLFRIVLIVFVLIVLVFTVHFMTQSTAPWNKKADKIKSTEVNADKVQP